MERIVTEVDGPLASIKPFHLGFSMPILARASRSAAAVLNGWIRQTERRLLGKPDAFSGTRRSERARS